MVSLSDPVLDTAANTEVNPVDVPDMDVLFKLNIVLYVSSSIMRYCPIVCQLHFEEMKIFVDTGIFAACV